MAKISKSFRLSEQAQENLRQLSEQSGSSETAIVEISLAFFAKVMQHRVQASRSAVPEPEYPPDEWLPNPDGSFTRQTSKQRNASRR